ncbi:MAG: hypothetical protein ABSF89_17805 [Acidimicrobiales bacterium]
MTALEALQVKRTARTDDRQAVLLTERNECRALLLQVEAERDNLRAQLAGALEEVEHWRTLAEYRGNRLLQDSQRGETNRC